MIQSENSKANAKNEKKNNAFLLYVKGTTDYIGRILNLTDIDIIL